MSREASENFISELNAIESSLDKLSRKLESQFEDRFDASGVHNPLNILKRVQRLQGELPELRAACQQLIERKQALMDVARQQLVSNRQRLQGLSQQAGCQLPESADVYADFSQVLTEWNAQVSAHRPLPDDAAGEYQRTQLNKALADSMLTR